jgi:ankyrin repeat protein
VYQGTSPIREMAFPRSLHVYAVEEKNFPMFEIFLNNKQYMQKVSLDAIHPNSKLSLLHMVCGTHFSIGFHPQRQLFASHLLHHGANVDVLGGPSYNYTPLMHVLKSNHPEFVQFLIDAGAAVESSKTMSPIGGAMHVLVLSTGGEHLFNTMLNTYPHWTNYLNDPDPLGRTPLMLCAFGSAKMSFPQLVRLGMSISSQDNQGKNLLIHLIEQNQQLWPADKACLIEQMHGTDLVNATDVSGKTAIHYCKSVENLSFLQTLGANPNLVDHQGRNALFHTELQCRSVLLNQGMRLDLEDIQGKNIVMHVFMQYMERPGRHRHMKSILMHDTMDHTKSYSKYGHTSLHLACFGLASRWRQLDFSVVQHIIDRFGDPSVMLYSQRTALSILLSKQGYYDNDFRSSLYLILVTHPGVLGAVSRH